MKKIFFIILLAVISFIDVGAQQITGRVVDKDGYAISYASISYKGHKIAVSSDIEGKFKIDLHSGWDLTVSCLGFKSKKVKVDDSTTFIEVQLADDSKSIGEVVVKSKKGKYHRKDNPAVALMRRVIAAKKKTDLTNYDFYQYDKYQKLTSSINNITPEDLKSKFYSKRKYMVDQVEVSPYNNKLTLPFSVDETVTQHLYRKNPKKERDIIKGQQTNGIGNVLQTGEMFSTMLKDVFTDVDIYDDHVRLLQFPFPSPIGNTAISFYHFYIEDTVYVDRDLCYHLQFIPANQQDFGFRGEIFVLADSSLHVKKCNLFVPHNSDVNFVDDMKIEQEYTKLPNGEWVLTKDDMVAELSLVGFLKSMLVVRNTRLSNYEFNNINPQLLKGKAKVKHDANAMNRKEAYWDEYRSVEMTKSETGMKSFINRMQNSKGWKWIIFGLKACMENYVETGKGDKPSYFDFGPVTTYLSKNYVDGIRLRMAGRTTAALNPHLFWNGYGAFGTKSGKLYYGSEITYSLNKKDHSPFEFPQRNIVFESTSDVMSPSDVNLIHNKDNIFMKFRATSQDEMFYYNRQRLSFKYETDWGLRYSVSLATENNKTAGELHYYNMDGSETRQFRKTNVELSLSWNPGVTYVNTKQQRFPVNLDSPELTISHNFGLKNFIGGKYQSNVSHFGIYKRQWLGSFGYLDFNGTVDCQWNKVPFPLLIQPPINLSFFEHEMTVNMLNDWEFLNDRQAFWSLSWYMNGKLFNRIPLVRKLKWREYLSIKGLWGSLTDKNNPFLEQNNNDASLFKFPSGAHVMNNKVPYWEAVVGVTNIFKFFTVEYVRRLNYTSNRTDIHTSGIRFGFDMSF